MPKNKFFELKGSNGIHILPNPKIGPFLGCFLFVVVSALYLKLWPKAILIFLFESGAAYYVQERGFFTFSILSITAFFICLPPFFQSSAFQTDEMIAESKRLNSILLSKRDKIYVFSFLFLIPLIISLLLHPPIWTEANELNYQELERENYYLLYGGNYTVGGLIGLTTFFTAYYFMYLLRFFGCVPVRFTLYLQQSVWEKRAH